MTDSAGQIINSYDYSVYGSIISSSELMENDINFTGHKNDPETGLIYMKSRYYDASLCRFISADTMGVRLINPQTMNRYSYVVNDPVNFLDPDGHEMAGLPYEVFTETGVYNSIDPQVLPTNAQNYPIPDDIINSYAAFYPEAYAHIGSNRGSSTDPITIGDNNFFSTIGEIGHGFVLSGQGLIDALSNEDLQRGFMFGFRAAGVVIDETVNVVLADVALVLLNYIPLPPGISFFSGRSLVGIVIYKNFSKLEDDIMGISQKIEKIQDETIPNN